MTRKELARNIERYLCDWFTVEARNGNRLVILFALPFEAPVVYVEPDGDDTWLVTDKRMGWSDLFPLGLVPGEREEQIAHGLAGKFGIRFWNREFRAEECLYDEVPRAVLNVFMASLAFRLAVEVNSGHV